MDLVRLIVTQRIGGESELLYCPYNHRIKEGDAVCGTDGRFLTVMVVECCDEGGNTWKMLSKVLGKTPKPIWKWSELHEVGEGEYE